MKEKELLVHLHWNEFAIIGNRVGSCLGRESRTTWVHLTLPHLCQYFHLWTELRRVGEERKRQKYTREREREKQKKDTDLELHHPMAVFIYLLYFQPFIYLWKPEALLEQSPLQQEKKRENKIRNFWNISLRLSYVMCNDTILACKPDYNVLPVTTEVYRC